MSPAEHILLIFQYARSSAAFVLLVHCHMPNCPYPGAKTHAALRQHFNHVHDSDIVIMIMQEGMSPLPRFPYCRMFMHTVNAKHF
jgi:hypothetical protein